MKKVKIVPGVFGKNYYFTEITQEISETCVFLLGLMFCMKDCMHLVNLDYPFQTFVYLNGDIAKYVHYCPSYDDISTDAGYSLPFEHIYDRIDNGDEDLLLLLVSLYGLMDAEELLAALKARPAFPPDPLLDSICKSSNGYLIYREQIEELYMHLTLCDNDEAVKFRRDWNKKKPSSREIAKTLKYDEDLTLYDIMLQRRFADSFEFYISPKYFELKNLIKGISKPPALN